MAHEISSLIEFVPNPFDGPDAVDTQFFTDTAYVNIDGTVANHHIFTPDIGENLFTRYHLIRAGNKELEQFKLFTGQRDLHVVFYNKVTVSVDDKFFEGNDGGLPGFFLVTAQECLDAADK